MSSRKVTGEAIGHPEALREWHGDEIGWQYADPMNQRMCDVIRFFGNANLIELDDFVEQLEVEGAGAGDELRERRREALRLFRDQFYGKVQHIDKLTDHAFAGHVEWIMRRKREIERSDVVLPLARDGKRKRETDKKKTEKLVARRKADAAALEDRNRQIFAAFTQLQSRGIPGPARKVAATFNLSVSAINNIVSKMRNS